MLSHIRHAAVLVLGLLLVTVVTACGGPSEADIEVTEEAMAKMR